MKSKSPILKILITILAFCLPISCCGCGPDHIPWVSLYDTAEVESISMVLVTDVNQDADGMYTVSYEILGSLDTEDFEWFISELNKMKSSDSYGISRPLFEKEERAFVVEYKNGDYEILSRYTQFQVFDDGNQKIYSQRLHTEESVEAFEVLFVRCFVR